MALDRPGFLIVGAAKSGTTSLYHYLKQHPEIYMSPVKEPDYFGGYEWKLPVSNINGPNPDLQIYQDWDQYLKLFKGANGLLAGEASPSTMFYYKKSIPEIRNRLGSPKIIILLRDPVERAYSHYSFLNRDGKENSSFIDALHKENQRMLDNFHYGYFYEALGYYHAPVMEFQENFTCGIWTFEQLKSQTERVFKEICTFLGVSSEYNPDLNMKFNVSGTPKSAELNNFLRKKNKVRDFVRPFVDLLISQEHKDAIMERLHHMNIHPKDSISPQARIYLIKQYEKDVEALSRDTSLDISLWHSFDR